MQFMYRWRAHSVPTTHPSNPRTFISYDIMSTIPLSFHSFALLPPELRIKIWQNALPDHDNPAIFTWKPGCWIPRNLTATEQKTNTYGPRAAKISWEHRHLTPVEVPIPLGRVNSEARAIGISWAHQRGFRQYPLEGRGHVFGRPFDPTRDILFVPRHLVEEFDSELEYRCAGPDVAGCVVGALVDVERIAVDGGTLEFQDCNIPPAVSWYMLPTQGLRAFSKLKALFFVIGEQPGDSIDIEYAGEMLTSVRPRWEIEDVKGEHLAWNVQEKRFDVMDDENVANKDLYQRIEATCAWACNNLARGRDTGFEARPVFAVQPGHTYPPTNIDE